jgi:hypothetical protein
VSNTFLAWGTGGGVEVEQLDVGALGNVLTALVFRIDLQVLTQNL